MEVDECGERTVAVDGVCGWMVGFVVIDVRDGIGSCDALPIEKPRTVGVEEKLAGWK